MRGAGGRTLRDGAGREQLKLHELKLTSMAQAVRELMDTAPGHRNAHSEFRFVAKCGSQAVSSLISWLQASSSSLKCMASFTSENAALTPAANASCSARVSASSASAHSLCSAISLLQSLSCGLRSNSYSNVGAASCHRGHRPLNGQASITAQRTHRRPPCHAQRPRRTRARSDKTEGEVGGSQPRRGEHRRVPPSLGDSERGDSKSCGEGGIRTLEWRWR